MLRNGHVRFGRRPAETRPGKPGQGAAGRPHTEHPTREGKVYCAVVLDVCSRRVVGWAIASSPTAALTTNALGMAIDNRAPDPGAVIHSDHGVQFGSWVFTRRARTNERKLLRPSVRPTHSGSPVDLCCLLFPRPPGSTSQTPCLPHSTALTCVKRPDDHLPLSDST